MARPVPRESKEFLVGMEVWFTDEPPVGGKLRVRVDDFQVEEIGGEPPRLAAAEATPQAAGPGPGASARDPARPAKGVGRANEPDERAREDAPADAAPEPLNEEPPAPTSRPPPQGRRPGVHTAARIRLENWENNLFLRRAIKELRIARSAVGFSGIKDKRAVTTQWFTFSAPEASVRHLARIPGVTVLATHATPLQLRLGDHEGNRFRIVLRQLPGDPQQVERKVARVAAQLGGLRGFPGFFGIQRFGSIRPITQEVGRALVHHDLETAAMTYLTNPVPEEGEEVFAARKRLADERDFKSAIEWFPSRLKFERSVIGHLSRNPGDWAGALRALPKNLLILFIHAYQAVVFNRVLSRRIAKGLPPHEAVEGDLVLPLEGPLGSAAEDDAPVPVKASNLRLVNEQLAKGRGAATGLVPGFEVPLAGGEPGEIERRVLEEEGLAERKFIVPDLPEASSRGMRRPLVVRLGDWEWSVEPDDLQKGAAKLVTTFSLPRGAYATSLLREIVKGETNQY